MTAGKTFDPVELIAVDRRTAASMCQMSIHQFQDLVDKGEMPAPVREVKKGRKTEPRWSVKQIRRAIDGDDFDDDPVKRDEELLDRGMGFASKTHG